MVLTVDQVGLGRNRDALHRYRRPQDPDCRGCHQSLGDKVQRGADALGIDLRDWIQDVMVLDWDVVDRIRDGTSMKLVVKGILAHEDARLCADHGVDAIVVSNHGGRAEDSGLASIEVLPEIVAAVAGGIPILVDSGFRRGPDVFKALALGASAVCIGRPYLWGLAAFGFAGPRFETSSSPRRGGASRRGERAREKPSGRGGHLKVVGASRLEPPRVDPVGRIERPAGYSVRPRTHSVHVRLAAALVLGAFLFVGVATTVHTLGAWCLTSAAGTPLPFAR